MWLCIQGCSITGRGFELPCVVQGVLDHHGGAGSWTKWSLKVLPKPEYSVADGTVDKGAKLEKDGLN